MTSSLEAAAQWAIKNAKRHGRSEVSVDDLVLGALAVIARFGIAHVGSWAIDLAAFGIDWTDASKPPQLDVTYSDGVVDALDRSAHLAKLDRAVQPHAVHLLAAVSEHREGVMAEVKRKYQFGSVDWRAALGKIELPTSDKPMQAVPPPAPPARPYLSPDEAAAYLGLHIQTIRGYIRTRKLPALRIAGERAVRIRREDLDALLEPFQEED